MDRISKAKLAVAAQPGIAADRFAREIVRILNVIGSALAAVECQTVGRRASTVPQYELQLALATGDVLENGIVLGGQLMLRAC